MTMNDTERKLVELEKLIILTNSELEQHKRDLNTTNIDLHSMRTSIAHLDKGMIQSTDNIVFIKSSLSNLSKEVKEIHVDTDKLAKLISTLKNIIYGAVLFAIAQQSGLIGLISKIF